MIKRSIIVSQNEISSNKLDSIVNDLEVLKHSLALILNKSNEMICICQIILAKLKIQFEEEKQIYQIRLQSSIDSLEKNNSNFLTQIRELNEKISTYGKVN